MGAITDAVGGPGRDATPAAATPTLVVTSAARLPATPAVYALFGGRGSGLHVAYVGVAGTSLRGRVEQHLVRRDSSIATGVYVRAAPVRPADGEGKFVRAITFNLDFVAARALSDYCQARQMGEVRALREIFRNAAREPVKVVTVGRPRDVPGAEWGPASLRSRPVSERRVFAPRMLTDEEARALVFPSVRAERARARLSRNIVERYAPTVYVQVRVRACLDAVAVTGLWRTMCERGVDHQTAARRLVAEARAPAARGRPGGERDVDGRR